MNRLLSRSIRASLCAALGLVVIPAAAQAAGWGTVKGRVVWAGGAVPERTKINVDKDKDVCLAKGPLLEERLVVNKSNKGVRWCLVWLANAEDYDAKIKIHPSFKRPGGVPSKVEIDQPHCMFEPHVVGLWSDKQELLFKNGAKIPHNVDVKGGALGPNDNKILPPGGSLSYQDIPPRYIPIQVGCGIHGWMKGYVGVYNSPYFAVTDKDGKFEIPKAPEGKYRLVIWHETGGWLLGGKSPVKGGGQVIEIEAKKGADLGDIKMNPPKED